MVSDLVSRYQLMGKNRNDLIVGIITERNLFACDSNYTEAYNPCVTQILRYCSTPQKEIKI